MKSASFWPDWLDFDGLLPHFVYDNRRVIETASPDPETGSGGSQPINKCVEDVMTNNNAIYSTMVRSGKTTYFVDVKEAKNGNKYLSISETKLEGEEKKRTTVRVFGETVDQFRQAIDEAAAAVVQQ